jgi:adenylate kinase family enzyme
VKRLQAYHSQTNPVLGFYEKKGVLRTIHVDNKSTPTGVFEDVKASLE